MDVPFPPPVPHPMYREPEWRVYGPYIKWGLLPRAVVVAVRWDAQGRKHFRTVRYPRFWVECLLGRVLDPDEDAYHEDGEEYDDRLDRYAIVRRRD